MNSHAKSKDTERYITPKNEGEDKTGYIPMVNAHVMHRRLHLKQDFSTWFNDCVEKFDLKEGVDFVFTKEEWNRKKICPKSEIKTDEIDNHHFTIYAAKKIAKTKYHRSKNTALYQTLCFG
ncbi:antA/AntB antirepressor family protein [Bartonella sp. B39]